MFETCLSSQFLIENIFLKEEFLIQFNVYINFNKNYVHLNFQRVKKKQSAEYGIT